MLATVLIAKLTAELLRRGTDIEIYVQEPRSTRYNVAERLVTIVFDKPVNWERDSTVHLIRGEGTWNPDTLRDVTIKEL